MKTKATFLLTLALLWPATLSQAQTYVAHSTATTVRLIDTQTGESFGIFNTPGANYNGLAWSDAEQRLYMIDTTDPAGQRFYSLDPYNPLLGLTDHGILNNSFGSPIPNPIYGGTFDNTGSGLYLGIVSSSATLSTWDPTGGTSVGQYTLNLGTTGWGGLQLGDIAVDGNGALWVSSVNAAVTQSAVLRYSSVDAAMAGNAPDVFHYNPSSSGQLINGLGYDAERDLLYGFRASGGSFFSIDQITGSLTLIDNTDPVFGLQGDMSDAFSAIPVPEPSGAFLLGITGILTTLLRRRRTS